MNIYVFVIGLYKYQQQDDQLDKLKAAKVRFFFAPDDRLLLPDRVSSVHINGQMFYKTMKTSHYKLNALGHQYVTVALVTTFRKSLLAGCATVANVQSDVDAFICMVTAGLDERLDALERFIVLKSWRNHFHDATSLKKQRQKCTDKEVFCTKYPKPLTICMFKNVDLLTMLDGLE